MNNKNINEYKQRIFYDKHYKAISKYVTKNFDNMSWGMMAQELSKMLGGYVSDKYLRSKLAKQLNLPKKKNVIPNYETEKEREKKITFIKEHSYLTHKELSKATGYSTSHLRQYVLPKLNIDKSKYNKFHSVPDIDLISELERRNYHVNKENIATGKNVNISMSRFTKNIVTIGVVSDTHFASKYQQITALHNFYDLCYEEKINTVIHAGDLVDGHKVYQGQEFELFVHGFDKQREYVIKNYPQRDGITTYMLGGNHDYKWFKHGGCDIIKDVSDVRKDIVNLGFFGSAITITDKKNINQGILDEGVKIGVGHSASGMPRPYSKSYPIERLIEGISPENKPDFYLLGHYHCFSHIEKRNCIGLILPCFQSQTPFLLEKKLQPEMGGVIIQFEISHQDRKYGISQINVRKIPYYVPIKEDYVL